MSTENDRPDDAPLDPEQPSTGEPDGGETPEAAREVAEPTLEEIALLRTDEIKEALKKAKERDGYLDRLQRLQAEFDNFRRRVARERETWRRNAISDLLLEVLQVVDNFDRALATDHGPKTHADYVRGVELVARQLVGVLKKTGVEPIEAKGEAFDPARHEAVSLVPTTDVHPGVVVEEVQRGYTMDDVVLRATRVCVSQAPSAPEAAGDETGETEES